MTAESEPITRSWLVPVTLSRTTPHATPGRTRKVEMLVPVTMLTTVGADPVVEGEQVVAAAIAMLKPLLDRETRVLALVSMETSTNHIATRPPERVR